MIGTARGSRCTTRGFEDFAVEMLYRVMALDTHFCDVLRVLYLIISE